MMRPLLLAATWTLVASSCQAEVRLQRPCCGGRAEVRVTPTASGPWTPLEAVGPDVLNPDGDVEGDGAPAVSRSDAGWLVAWSSPSHGALQLARATDGWQPTIMVPAPDAVGTPVVVAVDGGWIVATRRAGGGVSIAGCTDGSGGRVSELIDLSDGRLLGGRRSNGDAQFVIIGHDGCLEIFCVRMIVPDPLPIDVYRHVVCLPPPDQRAPAPGPRDPTCPRFPSDGDRGDRVAPPDGHPPRDDGSGDCGGGGSRSRQAPGSRMPAMRLQDILLPDGSTTGAVTWTSGGQDGFLDLSEDGPLLPVMTPSAEPASATRRG
jgi:hypothetical protein